MHGPFDNPSPGDVPLPAAPLVRVLAQVRFPQYTRFLRSPDAFALDVATALSEDYPHFEAGEEANIMIGPDGVTAGMGGVKVWRLRSADNTWTVSFSTNFMSIETEAYESRSHFTARLQEAWETFRSVGAPPSVERIGVRFLNRVEQPHVLDNLVTYLRSEISGLVGVHSSKAALLRSMSEALYQFEDDKGFTARWGLMPAGMTHDATLPPTAGNSWLLDMDSFHAWHPGTYAGDDIAGVTGELALKAYQFFRWAVEPSFLQAFGGDI